MQGASLQRENLDYDGSVNWAREVRLSSYALVKGEVGMNETPAEFQQIRQIGLDHLQEAVRSAAALRLRVKLNAADGDGGKVFPPTYAGGVYAVEDRRIDDKVVRCVLLDSVQSQANRMEEALLDAFLPTWRELKQDSQDDRCDLPILAVYVENHGWITSLTAPHRIHDAIIRDSELVESRNGKPERFRESSIGREVVAARLHNATALYKYCPTALVFGTWDSTAGEGLDAAKIPRAVVSEIIGVDISPGVRTASRIDPLGIRAQAARVYRLRGSENDWTLDPNEAATTERGERKKFGKGKPSDINHGNVTPDMPRFDTQEIRRHSLGMLPDILETTPLELRYELSGRDGRVLSRGEFRREEVRIQAGAVKPGGVTMAYALHTWTLSLTQLRRLRFPVTANGTASEDSNDADRDQAGRTVLAALALYALALQQERGYWLRSRCELLPTEPIVLEVVGESGGRFSLDRAEKARKIFEQALAEAEKLGLKWEKKVIKLEPTEKLKELVKRTDALGPVSEEKGKSGEEPADAGAES
jgi:CRISPR-associated protein Csb1